jgi:hypothetical protein
MVAHQVESLTDYGSVGSFLAQRLKDVKRCCDSKGFLCAYAREFFKTHACITILSTLCETEQQWRQQLAE